MNPEGVLSLADQPIDAPPPLGNVHPPNPKIRKIEKPLTGKQLAAAIHIAIDRKTYREIAEQIEITEKTLGEWRKKPKFEAEVERQKEIHKRRIMGHGIASEVRRLEVRNDLATRLQFVVNARSRSAAERIQAKGEGYQELVAQGAESGLVIERNVFYEGKPIAKEFSVDTSLVSSISALLREQAIERGEWAERREITGKGGGPLAVDNLHTFMTQLSDAALNKLRERAAAIREQKKLAESKVIDVAAEPST